MELCYLSLCLRFPPSTSSTPVVVKTKHETEREGQFFHPVNNKRMISAYPLISSLLFAFLLSLSPSLPSFSHLGESFPLARPPFFHLVPVLHPFLLSREGILQFGSRLFPPFCSIPLSTVSHQPKCIDGNISVKIDFSRLYLVKHFII